MYLNLARETRRVDRVPAHRISVPVYGGWTISTCPGSLCSAVYSLYAYALHIHAHTLSLCLCDSELGH